MKIRWVKYSDDDFAAVRRIRRDVFCHEVGFSEEFEFDEKDREALHLLATEDGKPVCVARIVKEEGDVCHIGRLACLARERGKGYGKRSLARVVEKCRELGGKKAILGAKLDKEGFYRAAGFTPFGRVFYEEGIPHVNMEMNLSSGAVSKEVKDAKKLYLSVIGHDEKDIDICYDIRKKVFCDEVGFSQKITFDRDDRKALHILGKAGGVGVVSARITREGENALHLGRLCVTLSCRGKGYGKAAVLYACRICRVLGKKRLVLGAKYDKKGFYESLGFSSYGDIFYEEGVPHIMMKKELLTDTADISRQEREIFDIPHHANLFALIYRRARNLQGEKGRNAADRGTKLYGRQRGARMARRAVRDNRPLTMENYLLYGEWEDKNHRSENGPAPTRPVYRTNVVKCGWRDAWKESGLLEYGKNYCKYVDKSLVRGFNPRLSIEIESTLSRPSEVCAFVWNGFSLETEAQKQNFYEKSRNKDRKNLRDFLYHCGHLLSAMRIALGENLGRIAAVKILLQAMEDFAGMYGEKAADLVMSRSADDFESAY